MFGRSGIALAFGIVFTVLLGMAAASDARHRRIPNSTVAVVLLFGVSYLIVTVGPHEAAIRVLEGGGTGLVIWLPVWMLGMMGAGDVKFFAAGASWLGPRLALDAALISAVLGGLLAIMWMISRPRDGQTSSLFRVESIDRSAERDTLGGGRDAAKACVTLPYGVAMATALGMAAWFPHFIR